jgi:TonB family protein
VRELVNPDYPLAALNANIQGTVRVNLLIGADGKVLAASADGAHPLLVQEAENNARRWVYGPFPPVAEFPIYHTVTYVFKLEGEPLNVWPPVVRTSLPDRIEIRAHPASPDYFPPDTGRQEHNKKKGSAKKRQ